MPRISGLDAGSREADDGLDDLEDAVGPLAAGVEGLASHRGIAEAVGDREVGGDRVLDEEEVANG